MGSARRRAAVGARVVAWCCALVAGQAAGARAADPEAAIERGKRALLERITLEDEIEYSESEEPRDSRVVRGKVIRHNVKLVVIRTGDGRELKINRSRISNWSRPGEIRPEMDEFARGGPTALAALALVSAGMPTNNPTMAAVLEGMAKDNSSDPGTYVHSLRAAVWSLALERQVGRTERLKYLKLLRREAAWLRAAMMGGGGFSYTQAHAGRPDNSNTQFGHLGLWAAARGEVEIADSVWQKIAEYWLRSQVGSGGWGYQTDSFAPSASMTVAGCNSLYIVLDRYYAKADKPYQLFEGAAPNKAARAKTRGIYRAIESGDQFLSENEPDVVQSHGYELFGLERLSVASGRSVIGGADWFREHVSAVARRHWGHDSIADSFALLFLVHGRAPVIMQKLSHGEKVDDWNYYQRDLSGVCRYLTRTHEKLHRWQHIPASASLESMQDAPILYISGTGPLKLREATRGRIRAYLESGGTVFLHADRADEAFAGSARDLFEGMYADRGLRFEKLDRGHPLYSCRFRLGDDEKKQRIVPLEAIADGARLPVILCPVDIAGAWHQERVDQFERLFQMMANVRVFCAPPHADLAGYFDRRPGRREWAEERGELAIMRLSHRGDRGVHPKLWERYAGAARARTGISVRSIGAGDDPTEEDWAEADVVYLAAFGGIELKPKRRAALERYLKSGGLLLVEAADGQAEGIAAVREFARSLEIGELGILAAGHPIVSGTMPGGRALVDLRTTAAGSGLQRGRAPPPILTRTIEGRAAVLACPFDLAAGLEGHFVWNRSGYLREDSERIVDNMLLWRIAQAGK